MSSSRKGWTHHTSIGIGGHRSVVCTTCSIESASTNQTVSVGADTVAQASITVIKARHVGRTAVDESAWRVVDCKVDIIETVDAARGHGGHRSYRVRGGMKMNR